MKNFQFEIKEHCGEISQNRSGWKKELNLVSWNERPPKYDIREWDPEYTKMGKGITFSTEELIQLRTILNELPLD